MSKHTVIKLNDGFSMEEILEAVNENKINLTPDSEEWPADQELFASWLPMGDSIEINRVETTLEFPQAVEVKSEDKIELIPPEEDFSLIYNEQFIVTGIQIVRPKNEWYDRLDRRLLPLEKRTNVYETDAVFFSNNNGNYVSIQGSPKSTKIQRTKKDLLERSGLINHPPGVRLDDLGMPEEFALESDFFYWLYYLYKECEGIIPCQPVPVYILELSGFHGTALEDTQKTKSMGDRISELLTTNAFIFADDDIKALRLDLQYGHEVVEVELHHDGSIDLLGYDGNIGDVLPRFRTENVIVYIYKVLLPLLGSTYETCSRNGTWNRTIRDQFLNKIGVEMIAHITEELKKLTPNRGKNADEEDQTA